MLLSHFAVFILCLVLIFRSGKPSWLKPTACKFFMIDVTMKEINCKLNANCLNFYLYAVSCRIKKSGTPEQFWFVSQWRCWNFCLIWIRCKVIFLSRLLAKKKLSSRILKIKNNKGKHKRKNTMRTAEETVRSTYFPSKIRLQQDIHRQLFFQHSLESYLRSRRVLVKLQLL